MRILQAASAAKTLHPLPYFQPPSLAALSCTRPMVAVGGAALRSELLCGHPLSLGRPACCRKSSRVVAARGKVSQLLSRAAEWGTNGEAANPAMEEETSILSNLEAWQMKKMAAAADLGVQFVKVEALAAEVDLNGSDVLSWLEANSSETLTGDPVLGSYMEDVNILEDEETPAMYVPPSPIAEGDVDMIAKVERLMYTLKDVIPGPLADVVDCQTKWIALRELLSETLELQDPLFCLRGKSSFCEWLRRLATAGVTVNLHDIYYENVNAYHQNRWMYVVWSVTSTKDSQTSAESMADHSLTKMQSQNVSTLNDLRDNDDKLCPEVRLGASTFTKFPRLSGEAKLEMDESGQITHVQIKWYRTAKQGDEDFTKAKLWLVSLLNR